MAERLSYKELEKIKQELNCHDIYSFSKVNSFKTDPFGFMLHYLLHIPEDNIPSIYSQCGSLVHDLAEEFQADRITREEMVKKYKDKTFELEALGFKFDRTDEEKNENISRKYHSCNISFLENFTKIEGLEGVSESSVIIKIGNFVFVGYLDYKHIEVIKDEQGNIIDKTLVITDFKTSTLYKGDKILKEKAQLLLYSLGHIQNGWDISKVTARWCFTKYISVEVLEKKGTWKTRQIERNEIGNKLSASVKMWLKDAKRYSEEEINDFIVDMLVSNSIVGLPQDIQDKFKISDCYVYIDINEKELEDLKEDFTKTIHSMKIKEGEYARTKDDTVFWTEITKENEYFLAVLSGYSTKHHAPYRKYLEQKELDSQAFGISVGKPKNLDDDDIDIMDLLKQLED